MKSKYHLSATVLAIASLTPVAVLSQERCADDLAKEFSHVQTVYHPQLESTMETIKRLQDAGLDPNQYVVEFDDQLIPITYKYVSLKERASAAVTIAENEAENCVESVEQVRQTYEIARLPATLFGLEKQTRIDFAEIFKDGKVHKPFGGDSAFVPRAREQILKELNIGGDVAKVIRDPKQALPWNW